MTYEARAYAADLELAPPAQAKTIKSLGRSQFPKTAPTVYTAFDGDHFALVHLMRRHVLRRGSVPLNPESVVGYKASVDAYSSKFGVLQADIAIVQKADAIWIYTDLIKRPADLPLLAEGALLELLWYLRTATANDRAPSVQLVSVKRLLRGEDPDPEPLRTSFDEACLLLKRTHADLLDMLSDIDRWGVPTVAVALHHPADTKYRDWIRAYAHAHHQVAIVPSQTIEVDDSSLGAVTDAWTVLLRLADQVWNFPSIDGRPSLWADRMLALAHDLSLPVATMDWEKVEAPKAVHGAAWPLTANEAYHLDAAQSPREEADR